MSTTAMIDLVIPAPLAPLELTLASDVRFSDAAFAELCRANPDLRLERSREGAITIMPPTGGETSRRNAILITAIGRWSDADGSGVVFDSSGGFKLPNGAIRAPDVSWVLRPRLTALSPRQKSRFLPLCPDFVVELCSPTDRLADVMAKLDEYIAAGARLGWLIEPESRTVYIYRPGIEPERLDSPAELSGAPELAGLVVVLAEVWEPGI